MNWLSLVLNFAGLSAFALAMDVHHRALFVRTPSPSRRRHLKALGAMLQAFAFSLATITAGPGLGFVEWLAGLAASAFALSLLLSAPRRRSAGQPTPAPQPKSFMCAPPQRGERASDLQKGRPTASGHSNV